MSEIILSTGSVHTLDVNEAFKLGADLGFDGIEVLCSSHYATRNPRYLNRLQRQHCLPIRAVHTPFEPYLFGWSNHRDEVARIHQTIRLAERVQATVMVLHLPLRWGMVRVNLGQHHISFPWWHATHPLKKWMQNELAHVQAQTNVKIAIENMPLQAIWGRPRNTAHWNTPQAWSQVHQWLTLDTTHWASLGISPLEAYRHARERVAHVHLSNYANGYEHTLPQSGHLRLDYFLHHLRDDDYQGAVSLEVSPRHLGYAHYNVVRRKLAKALRFCRKHLTPRLDNTQEAPAHPSLPDDNEDPQSAPT